MTKLCSHWLHICLWVVERGSHGLVGLLDLGIRTQERQRLVDKSLSVLLLEDWADRDHGGRVVGLKKLLILQCQGGVPHYP